jgi:rod shape determining protein RodA
LPEDILILFFASLSEELGVCGRGRAFVFISFAFLKILKIASGSKQRVFCLVSLGMFFYLFFQTAVNIAMNIGLMPITGITLPLVSYGGSSLLTTLISLGMLESICRQGGETGLVEIK